MEKKKRLIGTVLVVAMLASMTACGGEPSDTASVADTTTASPVETAAVTNAPAEGSAASVEETTEPVTESPTEDSSLYAYYDLLAEEWSKTGETTVKRMPFVRDGRLVRYDKQIVQFSERNGKLYWIVCTDDAFALHSYDIATKESAQYPLQDTEGIMASQCYFTLADDCFWAWNDWTMSTVKKYDLEGNLIGSLPTDDGRLEGYDDHNICTSSGVVFSRLATKMIPADFSGLVDLPPLTIKDEHGLDIEIDISSYFGSYKNKAYFSAKADEEIGLFYLDLDTLTWNKVDGVDGETLPTFGYGTRAIGKYLIFKDGSIYDMESDELLGAKPFMKPISIYYIDGFPQTYYGGATNIEYSYERSCFYRVRYPGDGEEPDRAAMIETKKAGTDTSLKAGSDSLGRKDCNWSYVDDTYYILMDDSGFFLRTYDKGEEEEEIVYAFSMN